MVHNDNHGTTLRALARLVDYPSDWLHSSSALTELEDALKTLSGADGEALREFFAWLATSKEMEVEASYVQQVETSRQGSLYMFEHLLGESRARGEAMASLRSHYVQHGFLEISNELPDFLPVMLEFASAQSESEARQFLGEVKPVLAQVTSHHIEKQSPWRLPLSLLITWLDSASSPVPHLQEARA